MEATVVIDPQTVGKVADATGEIAKTTNTALEMTGRLGGCFGDALRAVGTMLGNEVKFIGAKRSVKLSQKWNELMGVRGLPAPTRPLPLNFAIPLFTAAILEEDDDLQDAWARLLVNAGDAATEMELRTAYVDILKGMSAFDVLNLSKLVVAALSAPTDAPRFVSTKDLPLSAVWYVSGPDFDLSTEVSISMANLARLGCIAPTSGYGGGISFSQVLVTELGLALYRACS
jgi:hypothetical protein